MNPTTSEAIEYDSGFPSSSIMTSDDEATLFDAQPAANAAREDDAAIIVAEVREEPQCEITVVESDGSHNTAPGVQQRQSANLQVQPVLLKYL
jgi:hypothetical protein